MTTKKKQDVKKVKCTGCQAYFVEEGELCDNCSKKIDEKPEEGEEEEEEK